jgi:lipopolysaccharide/colanic/teichoic acid biosynthesis glycosyltransferase
MDLSWSRLPSYLLVPRAVQSVPAGVSWYDWTKRVIDVSVAVLIVVLFLPLWALIAFIIKLTSRGPVLFKNVVVGQHGKPFVYYKFRTMFYNCSDAEHRRFLRRFVRNGEAYREVGTEGEESPPGANGKKIYKLIHDPRVTPFGRFLRKSSLDEIPQMINVLRGEMSLVGPRPPLWYEYEMYGEWEKQRLAVKPGITGLYQVTARDRVPFQEMVRIDLDYIRRRSLSLDLWIILRTAAVMAQGDGGGQG